MSFHTGRAKQFCTQNSIFIGMLQLDLWCVLEKNDADFKALTLTVCLLVFSSVADKSYRQIYFRKQLCLHWLCFGWNRSSLVLRENHSSCQQILFRKILKTKLPLDPLPKLKIKILDQERFRLQPNSTSNNPLSNFRKCFEDVELWLWVVVGFEWCSGGSRVGAVWGNCPPKTFVATHCHHCALFGAHGSRNRFKNTLK